MTASEGRREEKRRVRMLRGFGARIDKLLAPLWLISIPLFAIFLSHKAGEYALSGMATAVISVLPTTFPSMLLCDIYRAYGHPERITPLGCLFSFLFGISPAGLRALLLGNLCGFPMGAREVTECYKAGGLSKREAERLFWNLAFSKPRFLCFWSGLLSHLFWASCSCCVLLILVARMQGNRYDYSLPDSTSFS